MDGGTYDLCLGVSELAPRSRLVSRVSLECFPALVGRSGADYFWGELDFSVERSGGADGHELGSLLDEWGRAKVGVNACAETCSQCLVDRPHS
jgi:hypothetical protein